MSHSGLRSIGLLAGLLMCAWSIHASQPAGQVPAVAQGAKPSAGPDAARPRPPVDKKNIVEGTDEDDSLKGSDDDSWLFGKKGNDFLRGGKGRDVIDGSDADDTIDGGDGPDVLDGGAGNDTIRGGGGNDTIDGGDNDDLLDGGAGNDDVDGGDDNDVLRGGAGDDVLAGGDGNDSLDGGPGADSLSGNDGADVVTGGPDADRIAGGDGDDSLNGEAGDDWLDGGGGNDVIRGGAGLDTLLGSSGADSLDGGEEHDILLGGDGRDVLNGNSGDDLLLGGIGTDLVNGGDGNDILVIRGGDVPRGEVETLDGEAGTDRLLLNGFATQTVSPQSDTLTDPFTGGTYRLRSVERVEHTHVFTDVGSGATPSSSFLLVNPSSTTPVEARIVFSGDDGQLVSAASGTGAAGDQVTVTIPARGSLAVDPRAQGGVTSVSAQVFAPAPVLGVASATLTTVGTVSGVGESLLLDNATIPVLEDSAAGLGTGLLIVNSAVRTGLRLTLHARGGQELETGSTSIDLPPYGRRLLFVRDYFPRLGNFQGTMTVEGGIDRPQEGGPVAITVIQRVGADLVTHPALAVSPAPQPQLLRFASFPNGGDTVSALTLVNPSRYDRVRGTIAFFDEAGAPRPVAINGGAASATVPYDLGPYGSAVFTTSAGGTARHGIARVNATEGVVAGVLRVTTSVAGTVDSGPSDSVTNFIAPVRRDPSAGVTTEVVIGSTGTAATLQLALRDASGNAVAGGTATLRVPANGQVRRTIDDLFPASPPGLQGTLTATSDTAVTPRITQIGAAAPRAILMPVMATR